MIPSEWIIQGGATGLLAIVVIMVLRGLLVPRKTLQDSQKETEHWRDVSEELMEQNRQLLETTQVVRDVLRALPPPQNGQGGH